MATAIGKKTTRNRSSAAKKTLGSGGSPQTAMNGFQNVTPAQARNFLTAFENLLPALKTLSKQPNRRGRPATQLKNKSRASAASAQPIAASG